jgi:hypothetical protein
MIPAQLGDLVVHSSIKVAAFGPMVDSLSWRAARFFRQMDCISHRQRLARDSAAGSLYNLT